MFRVANDDDESLFSGSFFANARDVTVNGGEFYNVGGNLTIQRTGKQIFQNFVNQEWRLKIYDATDPREIVELAVASAVRFLCHRQRKSSEL